MRARSLVWIIPVALLSSVSLAAAQSAPELLEKGIYLEETAGRLDQAIEVYGRIVTDATADRALVAEALLRLGMCYLEKGWPGLAAETFDKIFARYPEQELLVARAREHMPDFTKRLELLPAPWPDGEVARMTLKLANGAPIGAFLITADATELEGEELWRLQARQKVFSDVDSQALRRVFARRDTLVPVASVFKHTEIGHFEAQYGNGVVRIETIGADARREEKLDGRAFDNEEGWHLFRRLPLDVGFKKTIKVISTMAGGVSAVEVEITRKEMITVPAGEFECYRMEFSAPQIFWFSTDPSRVLVKWEGSGVVAELDEVYVREPGESVYRHHQLGFSFTLPPDWLYHRQDDQGTEVLHLLDPNAEAQARVEIRRAPAGGDDCIFQAAARRELEQARKLLRDYELRPRSWSERDAGGWPAVSFAGNYRGTDRGTDHERVHYWTFIENAGFCVDFTLKIPADRFEELRPAFDSVLESYQAPPPEVPNVPASEAARAAESVLADFHLAASQADPQRFFEHLASDAVFFGPDHHLNAAEAEGERYFEFFAPEAVVVGSTGRYPVARLRALLSRGQGLPTIPIEQQVYLSPDQNLAWFEELIETQNVGLMRGTGVLRKAGGVWKLAHHSLTILVPRQLSGDLADRIEAFFAPS